MSKENVLDTDLYGITAEKYSLGRSNIEVVAEMLTAGIEIIQYREKNKKMLDKYRECKQIREMTAEAGAKLIVNDDVDLALSVEADGVHIGQEDLPSAVVRDLIGAGKIIGLSTHSPEQAQDALRQDVDYIGVGPIFPTTTKEDVCRAVGLDYLDYVVENVDLPFVAIGGIKEHNIGQLKKRGADCMALVTEIVGAEDIEAQVNNLRANLD